MNRLARALAAASLVLLTAGPAIAADKPDPRSEDELAKLVANRVAGKPVSCVNLRDLGSSQTLDKTAIVYERGSNLYVNRPDNAASLDSDTILVTDTFDGQICRGDAVRLVDRTSGFMRGFVILGDFVPYARLSAKH